MKKVTVGIIGCGTIANGAHIPAYMKNEDVEIKYFCDIIPERAKEAVEKYGCGIAVEDYHDVLTDPEVEAVSVCTPNKMHGDDRNRRNARRQACVVRKTGCKNLCGSTGNAEGAA